MNPTIDVKPSDKAREYLRSKGREIPTSSALPTASVSDAVVPVAAVENAPAPLVIPEVPEIQDQAGPAKSAGEAYLSQLQQEATAMTAAPQAPVTQSEQAIKQALGLLATESDTRTQLEEARGVTSIENQMRAAEQAIARQIAEIDAFDLQTITDTESLRIDASKRDITKRTFGAQAAEMNLQRSIQRAGRAAELRSTVAANLALQGNLEAATEQVDKALRSIYDPIRQSLEIEKFFLARNDKRLDAAQREAADIRSKAIDRQFAEIDRAISLSDAAVASGYASGENIMQLSALSGDPQAQAVFAQQIVAKGAREAAALERMARNASIRSSNASAAASAVTRRKNLVDLAIAGDQQAINELGFDPGAPLREAAEKELEQERAQENIVLDKQIDKQNDIINNIDRALGMTNAMDASSGIVRSGFLTGLFEKKDVQMGDTKIEGTGVVGGFGGLKGGFQTVRDKKEFLSTVNYLLLGEGFTQFSKLAEEGIKLTPVSEFEFSKIQESASLLNSLAEIKDEKIVGFGNTDPEVIQRELNTMRESAALIRDEKAAVRNIGYEAYVELQALQQGQ